MTDGTPSLEGSRKRDRQEPQTEGTDENDLQLAIAATNSRPSKRQRVDASRSLFIRSLPPSATSDSLTELVSQHYPVKHSTVVLDPKTKTSRGYGFVTLADPEDTQEAMKKLDKLDWEGRKLRVEVAEPRHRKKGTNEEEQAADEKKLKRKEVIEEARRPSKLIVRNLPWSIKTPDQLASIFQVFGKVKYADLPSAKGKLSGFGFVTMKRKKCAEKALETINGKEVDGRTLAIDWAVDKAVWEKHEARGELQAENEQKQETKSKKKAKTAEKTQEGGGSPTVDDDVEAFMMSRMENLESEPEDDEDVEGAQPFDTNDESDAGEEPSTQLAAKKQQLTTDNTSTVFVRNLPYTTTDEDLKAFFSNFGPVRYARVVADRATGRAVGTGFVCFFNQADSKACIRGSPRPQSEPKSAAMKHSVLQDENLDPDGRYTFDGRILQVAQAVSKDEAAQFADGDAKGKDRDKRRLFLLSEGSIESNSPLYAMLAPSEIKMREASLAQRKKLVQTNPTLHLSFTRLSIRNIPRNLTSKDLKDLARKAVVGFATDVKEGRRQPLSKEENQRGGDDSKEAEHRRRLKRKGVVKQAKIVFETAEGTKAPVESEGAKSRGYGFIEYSSHRWALMGLRWLNGHQLEDDRGKKLRLVVEFAIENAKVVMRRTVLEGKSRQDLPTSNGRPADRQPSFGKPVSQDRSTKEKGKSKVGKGGRKENGVGRKQQPVRAEMKNKAEKKEDSRNDLEQTLIARKRIVRKKKANARGKA